MIILKKVLFLMPFVFATVISGVLIEVVFKVTNYTVYAMLFGGIWFMAGTLCMYFFDYLPLKQQKPYGNYVVVDEDDDV